MSPVRSVVRVTIAQRPFGICGMNTSSAHCDSAEYSLVIVQQLCGAKGAVEVLISHGVVVCAFVDDGLVNVLYNSLKTEPGRHDFW